MTHTQKTIKYLALAFAIFLIFTIFSVILNILGIISNVFVGSNNTKTSYQDIILDNDITSLDINLEVTDLKIVKSDYFKIETNSKYIENETINKTLKIKDTKKRFIYKKNKLSVILYLPETLLENVTLKQKAGSIEIDNLSTSRLNLELGVGKLSINNLNVDTSAQIESGLGKVDIKNGKINNLNLSMGIGEVILTTDLSGQNTIDGGIGNLELNLLSDINKYTLDINKGLGNITVDGKNINDGIIGSGESNIKIDGGIGNITVDFKN